MNRSKSIREAFQVGNEKLLAKGIDDGAFVARLFINSVTGLSIAALLANDEKLLSQQELLEYESMLERRLSGEPTQYILGKWEFMGLAFAVKNEVLIPRADTEILVEAVLKKSNSSWQVLDLCTGTGCIAISLAVYGNVQVIGVDINPIAVELAIQNAMLNSVYNIKWYEGDLFTSLPNKYIGKLNAIVSNPPYIKTEDLSGLMPEVRDFEPHLALDGGIDGLDFYRNIVKESIKWLDNEGWLFFEIGMNQGIDVARLMETEFEYIEIIKDLAGLDRVVMGRRKVLNEVV